METGNVKFFSQTKDCYGYLIVAGREDVHFLLRNGGHAYPGDDEPEIQLTRDVLELSKKGDLITFIRQLGKRGPFAMRWCYKAEWDAVMQKMNERRSFRLVLQEGKNVGGKLPLHALWEGRNLAELRAVEKDSPVLQAGYPFATRYEAGRWWKVWFEVHCHDGWQKVDGDPRDLPNYQAAPKPTEPRIRLNINPDVYHTVQFVPCFCTSRMSAKEILDTGAGLQLQDCLIGRKLDAVALPSEMCPSCAQEDQFMREKDHLYDMDVM